MYVNYIPVNKIIVEQKFPILRIVELLNRLQGSTLCPTFDVADTRLQISIHADDRHKISFHTLTGELE